MLGCYQEPMARTRNELGRDVKVAEIVASAERRLAEGGYEGLSVAAIARELGLAQNAVYWYFPSKDHLFVAAMEEILRQIAARKPKGDVGVVDRILWFTDQFAEIFDLRGAMYEQARRSEVVADFAERLDGTLDRMLSHALQPHVPAKDLPVAVASFRATVQGAYVQGLDRRARRRVLSFALDRLMKG
jgi:TetR/AcrR family transcriptional regulator, cholesterol catabolism regulator